MLKIITAAKSLMVQAGVRWENEIRSPCPNMPVRVCKYHPRPHRQILNLAEKVLEGASVTEG
jgi:hypothetical protein